MPWPWTPPDKAGGWAGGLSGSCSPWPGPRGKKAVRLDILGTNAGAERLYTGMGFRFVQARTLFYEDTGWTEYRLFEYPL